MNSSLPTDLLKLKARFETWRRTRQTRARIPEDLRQAASAMLDRYSASTLCRALRLHPRTLKAPLASNSAATRPPANTATSFFSLLPSQPPQQQISSLRRAPPDSRLVIERPDGARLTLLLPPLDPASLSALCTNFLRS
jgi:Lon protease-like protein